MTTGIRDEEHDHAAIRSHLARMSHAWQNRRYDALAACFDERAVIVAPGFAARVEGRDACIETYRQFMERATIRDYHESVPIVDVWGDTAVATYRWEMAWQTGGPESRENGYDLFVLRRAAPGEAVWTIVWRTITTTRDA